MTETERTTAAPSCTSPDQTDAPVAPDGFAQLGKIRIIEPRELSIRLDPGNGGQPHEVILQHTGLDHLPQHIDGHSGEPSGGIVVVLLDVDGEGLDIVLVDPSRAFEVSAEETLAQAWEAITPAREALRRVRRA